MLAAIVSTGAVLFATTIGAAWRSGRREGETVVELREVRRRLKTIENALGIPERPHLRSGRRG